MFPAKRVSNEAGRSAVVTGGTSAPWARQKGLSVNTLHHQSRQRTTVRRLTPTKACSCRARAGVSPLCIAVISTTMAPRNTLRPRNRSDPGVSRLRHSRAAQQKLKRSRCSGPSPAGTPRGLRSYEPQCNFAPHR
jgi:hypothetical protein